MLKKEDFSDTNLYYNFDFIFLPVLTLLPEKSLGLN